MSTQCFVDADLAGNTATRKSQIVMLLFVNCVPVIWHGKCQNTVEANMSIEALWYKLRVFSLPVDAPTNVYCDNEAVTKNCSIPELMLKKKHHAIAYHHNYEAITTSTIRIVNKEILR